MSISITIEFQGELEFHRIEIQRIHYCDEDSYEHSVTPHIFNEKVADLVGELVENMKEEERC